MIISKGVRDQRVGQSTCEKEWDRGEGVGKNVRARRVEAVGALANEDSTFLCTVRVGQFRNVKLLRVKVSLPRGRREFQRRTL